MAKTLYTAAATVTGGRDEGHGRTSDGALDIDLRSPKETGGPGGGTNPEQLFAVGYAACFEGAVKVVGRRMKLDADDVRIDAEVDLVTGEDRSFGIEVRLDVTLPQIHGPDAHKLIATAHRVCPYSNAVRGNVPVTLSVNGAPLHEE